MKWRRRLTSCFTVMRRRRCLRRWRIDRHRALIGTGFMDSAIIVGLIGVEATIGAAVITAIYSRRGDDGPPARRMKQSNDVAGTNPDSDAILERLERYRQRATFGAVAGVPGLEPQTLFDGYP